ncbi:MAG: thioredoxin domain-containing protein, partial [Mariprofundaceae bacterium]|nr:thioredoxin domain-containing protein [Mariprofundaceae bacterium]
YSAEDADSEGEEGKFYVWTASEIEKTLGKDDAVFAASVFGATADGNMQDEASGQNTGTNVLHMEHPPASEQDKARLEHIRKKLFAVREKRVHPFRDDKILTDWNGMMIAALAIAGRSLNEPAYSRAARKAADFLLRHLRRKDGRLLHRFRKGSAGLEANLDDYAFLVQGLIELYETDFEVRDLQTAIDLNTEMLKHFRAPQGGLYFTADDAEGLLVRPMDGYDGAIPSGNSIAMMNLVRLARMTGNTELEQRAAAIIHTFSKEVRRLPSAFASMMSAFMFAESRSYEVVLAGNRRSADGKAMLHAIRKRFIPNKVVLWQAPQLAKLAPYTAQQKAIGGKATAYICENFQCNLPVTDPQQALDLLRSRSD